MAQLISAQLLSPLHTLQPYPPKCHKKERRKSTPQSARPPRSALVGSLLYLRDGMTHSEREEKRLREERRQILSARMETAETFHDWDAAADELDIVEGHDEWKEDNATGDYNPELIESRLRELDEARTNCDLAAMLHMVRTSLSRDLGGMGNIDLYRHSHRGTKRLVERYVDSALQTISCLVEKSSLYAKDKDESGPRDMLQAVLFARQSFGRSALLLSGGGTFGMSHIGVLKALFEAGMLPRIISGASAGSIVCSVFCCKTDDEIPTLCREFPYGDLAVFEEEGNEDGILDHVTRLLTTGNWSDIRHLTRVMRDQLGDITFQEAYNRTRRICNICVSSASIYELPRLLNYVTAPNVMIWSAVAASCSVPVVFTAAHLLAKNPITGEHSKWNPTPDAFIDGSVDNDLPMTRLAEMFNVNHFIVSQVNPHVTPFLAKEEMPCSAEQNRVFREESDWVTTLTALAKSEALHRMQFMAEMGIFPNLITKLRSVLSQRYSGDINILPALGVKDLPMILKNPTTEYMQRTCLLGERATWPKLSRIRDRCSIELALDRAVHSLKARVVFSKSQVNLRRLATGSMVTRKRGSHGSHEPLTSIPHGAGSDQPGLESLRELRRSSGSSVMMNSWHGGRSGHREVADDDSDEDERLEMPTRGSRDKPKLRLKRARRLSSVPRGPNTSPILSSDSAKLGSFDLSKSSVVPKSTSHIEVPSRRSLGNLSAIDTKMALCDRNADSQFADTASMTSPQQDTSNEMDMDSSDLHSSDDADIDSQTDDSATALGSPSSGMATFSGDDWPTRDDSAEQPEGPAGAPSMTFKEDMFSLARRECSDQNRLEDSIDPGAGLWN